MKCPNCGEKIRENAEFCHKCGAPLTKDEPAKKAKVSPVQRRNMILTTILSAAACAVVVMSMGIYAHRSEEEELLQTYLAEGNTYMDEGNYEEAAAAFKSALQIDPKAAEPYNGLVRAYTGLGDMEQAQAVYNDALDTIQGEVDSLTSPQEASEMQVASNSSVSNATTDGNTSGSNGTPSTTDSNTNTGTGSTGGGKTDSDPIVETSPVDEEAVQGLLQTFSVPVASELESWYDGTGQGSFEYEDFDADQVYTVAALSLIQTQGDELYDTDEIYCFRDGTMSVPDETDETPSQEYEDDTYIELPEELYAQTIQNIFGDEYPLTGFVENESEWGVVARKDDSGQFYLKVCDLDPQLSVTIEECASAPDETGAYDVLAKYSGRDREYYMQCQVILDDTSEYGCIISGMTPAGDGEVDTADSPR